MTHTLAMFLAAVEKKAFRMAMLATKNEHEALDIVQDSMEKLVRNYGDKAEAELAPLFHRIHHNSIMDWHRKKKVRNLLFFWQQSGDDEEQTNADQFQGVETLSPEQIEQNFGDREELLKVIEDLPVKQQQCFLLRCWEAQSVAKTAEIMGCSEGTVKTHYFRAVAKLQQKMEVLHE